MHIRGVIDSVRVDRHLPGFRKFGAYLLMRNVGASANKPSRITDDDVII